MMSFPNVIASEAKQSSARRQARLQESAEFAADAALFCLARFARSWIASAFALRATADKSSRSLAPA
jgi:hypothetical protein